MTTLREELQERTKNALAEKQAQEEARRRELNTFFRNMCYNAADKGKSEVSFPSTSSFEHEFVEDDLKNFASTYGLHYRKEYCSLILSWAD